MRNLYILLKKELNEGIKTHKGTMILIVFVLFGILSPLLAKMMPQIISSSGVDINMPDPVLQDSYLQFFKNLSQIGILVVILAAMGIMAKEKSSGTFILLISKGVKRRNVVIAKYLSFVIMTTICYIISVFLMLLYTYFLFDDVIIKDYIISYINFYVYILYVLAITVFFSTLSKSIIQAGVMSFVAFFATIVLNYIPVIKHYSPGKLVSLSSEIIVKNVESIVYLKPLITSLVIIAVLIELAGVLFNQMEIGEI